MQWRIKMAAGAVAAGLMGSPNPSAASDTMVDIFRLSDARDLVTVCSVPSDQVLHVRANAFCLGYMSGAMQFYEAAVKAPEVEPFVCAPKTLSRASLRDIFLDWARSNPRRLVEPAIEGLVRAAVAKFPCNP